MNKKILIGAFAAILIFLAAGFLVLTGAPGQGADLETFTVGLNAKMPTVIQDLKSKGFIKSPWAFGLALGLSGVNKIESGGYKTSKDLSAWQLAGVLNSPPGLKWVVIPEGLRKEEVAGLLAAALGWPNEVRDKRVSDYTALDFDHVEGVYFPDTYLIPMAEQPLDVAKRLQNRFDEKFAPLAPEAVKQNIKWTTLLKVASLIQREAAGPNDMPLIAGVIWNRLLIGMKLDIDATLQYARGHTDAGWWAPITPADKQIDSPYNTYKYAGLPPHPICNPGLKAINAALAPQETKCLYYLHDRAGGIHCAETYAEHLRNIETYLR